MNNNSQQNNAADNNDTNLNAGAFIGEYNNPEAIDDLDMNAGYDSEDDDQLQGAGAPGGLDLQNKNFNFHGEEGVGQDGEEDPYGDEYEDLGGLRDELKLDGLNW